MPQNVGRDAAEFSTAAGGHESCLVAAQLCDPVLFRKDPFALGVLYLGPLGLDQIGVYGDRLRDSVLGVSSLHPRRFLPVPSPGPSLPIHRSDQTVDQQTDPAYKGMRMSGDFWKGSARIQVGALSGMIP